MPYVCFFLHYPLKSASDGYTGWITKYAKLVEAQRRLVKEQDIVSIIELNRALRFLKKVTLKPHQRQVLRRSHKFVITDRDIEKPTDEFSPK